MKDIIVTNIHWFNASEIMLHYTTGFIRLSVQWIDTAIVGGTATLFFQDNGRVAIWVGNMHCGDCEEIV